MDLLKEMVAFAYVVDCAGFTPAARALGVEPSSISRSVMRLERALGARLLARSSKAITLTEIGAKIYVECSHIVGAAREVRGLAERHSTSAAGMLRVSAPVTLGQIWLAPLVAGFTERYPDVDLSITLSDVAVDLAEAQIDVALRICTVPPEETAARILFAVPYVLVASPAYLSQY
ncbi:MAG: LysR family transcriptional regulator, partial [Duganella sp.]